METKNKETYAPLIEDLINQNKDIATINLHNGLIDYSLRCVKGTHKDNFVFLNLTPEGEVIGSDSEDKSITLFIENANLDKKHAQIIPKQGKYFLRDLNSSTGTWIQQGNDEPIMVFDGLEINIGVEEFRFSFGEIISDTLGEWLKRYDLSKYKEKLVAMGYDTIQNFADIKASELRALSADQEDVSRFFNMALDDFSEDLVEGHENRVLVVKNLQNTEEYQVFWAGCSIGNAETALIQVKTHHAHRKTQISQEECHIKFQFGKYWIVNTKEAPITMFIKLKGGPSEHDSKLRPADIIRLGSTHMMVNRFNYANFETTGSKQRTMEDKTTIIQDMPVSLFLSISFFGVFDGHGGMHCVRVVHESMPNILRDLLVGKRSEGENSAEDAIDSQDSLYIYMKHVLEVAAAETDLEVHEKYGDHCVTCGSTGVMVIIVGNTIFCANIGDSRAILSSRKKPILLSKDHKPSDPVEKRRIEEAGGKVRSGRVNGQLGTARAFGDFKYKRSHALNVY